MVESLNFGIIGHGRMGKLVEGVLREEDSNILVVVDPNEGREWSSKSLDGVDSCIVFTSPDAGYDSTRRILSSGVDAVVGTTDFYLNRDGSVNEDMLGGFRDLAIKNNTRLFYTSNFSEGANAVLKHLPGLAKTMNGLGYDVCVEERHHGGKADVSGTAKSMGRVLQESGYERRMIFGDCERKRGDDEMTVASSRVGYEPGTHTVVFGNRFDTFELIHRIRDPKVFALGAVKSAYWLRGQEPGIYTMDHRLR